MTLPDSSVMFTGLFERGVPLTAVVDERPSRAPHCGLNSRPSIAASREGRCDHAHGGPPPVHPHPGAVVDRTQSWLAVALVAAAVVLMAVVSDAATVPQLGLAQRPVVTTVITLSAVPDPRATEGPAPQDRQRVLSW